MEGLLITVFHGSSKELFLLLRFVFFVIHIALSCEVGCALECLLPKLRSLVLSLYEFSLVLSLYEFISLQCFTFLQLPWNMLALILLLQLPEVLSWAFWTFTCVLFGTCLHQVLPLVMMSSELSTPLARRIISICSTCKMVYGQAFHWGIFRNSKSLETT